MTPGWYIIYIKGSDVKISHWIKFTVATHYITLRILMYSSIKFATKDGQLYMRGSRRLCQRESSSDVFGFVFVFVGVGECYFSERIKILISMAYNPHASEMPFYEPGVGNKNNFIGYTLLYFENTDHYFSNVPYILTKETISLLIYIDCK